MRRQGPLGKNPYYGTEIKYFIRDFEEEDSLELKVEISDVNGEVIRTFSSEETYKSKRINLKEGYSSIKWGGDVDGFIPPKGVMTPRGSDGYMGSFRVNPGKYSVKFTFGSYEKSSDFNILADPRQSTSISEFERKEKLLKGIHGDIADIYESLIKMQDARSQLSDLTSRVDSEKYSDINDLVGETIDLINKTELMLISPKQKTFQDVINFRNQLDAQMFDLLNTIDGNIPPVTKGEISRYDDLNSKWLEIKKGFDKVLDNISQINNLIIENSVPFISKGE